MNIQRWKGIVWLGSLAVGGYLVFYVYDFLKQRDELAKEIDLKEIASVLDSAKKPPEQKMDVIDYTAIQKVFHNFDWTGKPIEKPVAPQGNQKLEIPKVPVSSLLSVLAIREDRSKPERSIAYVRFNDQKLKGHLEKDDTILHPEAWSGPDKDMRPGHGRLFAPYQDIRVEAITGTGVVFAFDDAARDKETVAPVRFTSPQRGELGIVMVGPEGAIQPQLQTRIQPSTEFQPFRPEQLMQIRKNEYQVGTETLKALDRDYSVILSRDVSASTYKNPRTGTPDGIKITHVSPNSIPDQAGLSEGEVLKSINGHKVTSVNDAIAFVKANANGTDTWTAIFEKQGREFTRTYHSPER